jgi:hypothetical protein
LNSAPATSWRCDAARRLPRSVPAKPELARQADTLADYTVTYAAGFKEPPINDITIALMAFMTKRRHDSLSDKLVAALVSQALEAKRVTNITRAQVGAAMKIHAPLLARLKMIAG